MNVEGLLCKLKIKSDYGEGAVFEVNYEGYASLYLGEQNGYISKNQVTDFAFRGYRDSDHTDGVSFWNLTEKEVNSILTAFEFKKVEL